ncbi:hypothetical protein KEM52_000166, partial [Ascosphaera acerosa]
VALVDAQGNWSIWDVSQISLRENLWRAQRVLAGCVGRAAPAERHDGWARVMWLGSVNQLLLCERQRLTVVHRGVVVKQDAKEEGGDDSEAKYEVKKELEQGSEQTGFYQFPSDALNLDRPSEWVLDVVRSRTNMSDVFVLTTLKLVWMSLTVDDDDGDGGLGGGHFTASQAASAPASPPRLVVRLEWYHHRDAEDVGLKLSPLHVGKDFSLVLYSQLNPLAQIYRFAYSPLDPSIPISVADPSRLQLPPFDEASTSLAGGADRDPAASHLYSTLVFQELEHSLTDDPRDPAFSLRLVKLVAQRARDGSVAEALYTVRTPKDAEDSEYELFSTGALPSSPPGTTPSAAAGALRRKHRQTTTGASTGDGLEHFIVDDWVERPVPGAVLPARSDPLAMIQGMARSLPAKFPIICDLSLLYSWLEHVNARTTAPVEDVLSGMSAESVVGSASDSGFFRTLNDASHALKVRVDDLERCAGALSAAIDALEQSSDPQPILHVTGTSMLLPYSSSSFSSSTPARQRQSEIGPAVGELYDTLVRDYISPLPDDVPVTARVQKEQLVRDAMAGLLLSQVVICRRSPGYDVRSGGQLEHDGEEGGQGAAMRRRQSAPVPPSPQPHPSAPGLTEISLPPEPAGPDTSAPVPDRDPLAVLRRYTNVSLPTPLTQQVTSTLAHWSVGADPARYDWQATRSRIARDEEEELDPALRERALRAQRRRERERERASRRGGGIAGAGAPPSIASSQVVPAIRQGPTAQLAERLRSAGARAVAATQAAAVATSRSSQLMSSQATTMVPMTQPERGVFGGREARRAVAHRPKKKKAKRAAGF